MKEAAQLHPLLAAAKFMTTIPEDSDDPVSPMGGKYSVPRGTNFRNIIRLVQKDPAIYGSDADVFPPERMLDEHSNKSRAYTGRDFAWQEVTLVVAMLLQNFDFRLANPEYELEIQQTLAVKPKNIFLHAIPYEGLDPVTLERRLHAGDSNLMPMGSRDAEGLISCGKKSSKPMSVFFGGNMGTCESLAHSIGNAASSHDFSVQVLPLDDATKNLSKDRPYLIITSSYGGQPQRTLVSPLNGLRAFTKSSLLD
ncbi:MAG: hypothetical protein Q9164_004327 [Protoblastenia rupestris]